MDIQELIQSFGRILISDFLRYFIPASIAFFTFWILLDTRLAHRFIQKRKPGKEKLWFEFRYSLSTVLIFAIIGLGIFIARKNGAFFIYENIADKGIGYFFLSLAIMLIFHDTYFYWTHRWMHHPKIFKHVHLVHHLSTNPSPWAAYSFHPFEAVIQAMVLPLILLFLPVHGLAIFIFLIYMISRNVLGHLGYELFPKKFIAFRWLNWHTTTTHHSMHHQYSACNYGLYFTWWDDLMKTTHKKYSEEFKEVTSRKRSNQSIATIVILLSSITQVSAQSPVGHWMTFDERNGLPLSIIEISENPRTQSIEGKIDSIIVAPHLTLEGICTQCEGSKNGQKIIGLEMLWGFEKTNEEWKNGKILDPETGDIYSSKLWFEHQDQISVRGYGGPFHLFYRTQQWHRISKGKSIEGIWESIDDRYDLPRAHIELFIKNGKLTGRVRKIFLLPHEGNYPICTECPGELNGTQIVGLQIMSGYKINDNKWTHGKVLDPGNGTRYNSSFWLEGNDTLVIRGYWGPFFRTQRWKRIDKSLASNEL